MKRNYLLTVGMLLAGTICASAQTNFSKPKAFQAKARTNTTVVQRMNATPQANVVFAEDFSKFTAGSETAPDATDISGSQAEGYVINSKYLNQPGWYGKGVHQAGGVCALKIYEYQYEGYPDIYTACGYISTPETELFGDIEVTFRAKKTAGTGDFWVGLCDNENGPVDELTVVLTDEWQSYTFKSNKATFKDNNVVQFAPRYETEVLIDDIVIKRALTRTETPNILNPINNSFEEFVARWNPTKTAEKYRLNVYKKVEAPDYVAGTLKESFDGINVKEDGITIDTANPNYPEGWSIDVSANGKQDMNNTEGFFNTAPRSIMLDEVGDEFTSPETPAFIKEIRFWVRPSSMVYEYDPSMISVSLYDSKNEKWFPIANMPNYYMEENGMVYSFVSDQIGLGVNRVKFEYIQKGTEAVTFAIDDVELDYETQMLDAPVLENYETTDTFCVVKDIDPAHEHFYYVQAIQGDLVSDKTPDMWVDGITGLKPVVNAATNITENSFDISWTEFHNARSYSLELSKVINASSEMNNVVIMEENFDRVKGGTFEIPSTDWGISYDFADNGVCDTHWVSYQAQWVDGMIGTRGTNEWTGVPGFIASPLLNLENNGGAFDVELTVRTMAADEEIAVMIQPDLNENATSYKTFKCTGAADSYSTVINFEKGGLNGCHISIMSIAGTQLYLDNIKITQNLKQGDKCTAPYKSYQTETNSYSFTDLPEGFDYGVEVTAKGMKDYVYYTSERSDRMIVSTSCATGIEVAEGETINVSANDSSVLIEGVTNATLVEIYNVQGQKVYASAVSGSAVIPLENGIYLVKAGLKTVKVAVR